MPQSLNTYERALLNIPHLVEDETDIDRYLRALSSLMSVCDEKADVSLRAAMRDTVTFIAHDAFRRGFETCHENIVAPLRENTVPQAAALDAMRSFGAKVRNTISAAFEDEPGVPNGITVDIDEIVLPFPTAGDLQ